MPLYEFGPFRMDVQRCLLLRKDEIVPLTPKEFMLLEYLLRHKGRIVTQQSLSQAVWSMDFETNSNVVEVAIKRLRDKIAILGKPSLIQTVRGSGYMIEEE